MIFLFADDIKLVYSFESFVLNQTTAKIMEGLTSLDEWCEQ